MTVTSLRWLCFILLTCSQALSTPGRKSFMLSAFCSNNPFGGSQRNFPLPVPSIHIPWIWDAIYSQDKKQVEVIAIPQQACSFNQSTWLHLLSLFPQYSDQLGYGAKSNILVNANTSDLFDFIGSRLPAEGIWGERLTCSFYSYGRKVAQTTSVPVFGIVTWSSIGTFQIRCPAPHQSIQWNAASIERRQVHPTNRQVQLLGNSTSKFSVCSIPKSSSPATSFNLSVCAATMRTDPTHLIEWIEYHKLLAVGHFYLYITTTAPDSFLYLQTVLQAYVNSNVVTLIHWPYGNCMRGMGSGRAVVWTEKDARGKPSNFHLFQPPRAIAQSAALASCYSRFKHSSKYMIHLDDDEFIFLAPWSQTKAAVLDNNLVRLADRMFGRNPKTAALQISTMDVFNCPKNRNKFENNRPLPRLGRKDSALRATLHDGKLIMRTDRVAMFFAHYVSMFEPGQPDGIFKLPFKLASLMHFKVLPHESGSIFGATLPMNASKAIAKDCRLAVDLMETSDLVDRKVFLTLRRSDIGHHVLSTLARDIISSKYESALQSIRMNK